MPGVGWFGFWRVLTTDEIDALTERVVQAVLGDESDAGPVAFAMARALAQDRPALPALMLALPFAMAGNAIESMLGGGIEARERAQACWRISALIAADLAVLQDSGGATGIGALFAHWQAGDPVFFDAPLDQRGAGSGQ